MSTILKHIAPFRLALSAIVLLGTISCTTNQPINGTAVDDMTVALHQSIDSNQALDKKGHANQSRVPSKVLLPGIKIRAPGRYSANRRFDIAVKNTPARTFYMGLVTNTPVSLAVSPEIKGDITLNLKQVTIEQVLQTLENLYGYAYIPIPGGYEILPNALKTKIYTVNYLELQRESKSNMLMSSGEVTQASVGGTGGGTGSGGSSSGSSGGSSGGYGSSSSGNNNNNQPSTVQNIIGNVETKSTFDFWKQLERTLNNIIGAEDAGTSIDYIPVNSNDPASKPNTPSSAEAQAAATSGNKRSVTVNPLAGVAVVRAYPRELKQVDAYLDLVQNSVDRQVILEAKILEVTLNNQYQMGIDWKLFGANLNAIRSFPGTDLKLEDFPDAFSITAKFHPEDFTATLRALELQGNIQVLSSPKVATMNNQMSAIKVGTDEFFVTNINNNNNGNVSGGGTVVSQVTPIYTPFFSGITLDVTPQVDPQNNVTLHIHPAISLVKGQQKSYTTGTVGSGTASFDFARSTIRESDTIVHSKNGQVIIIGGLMQNATTEDVAQLPVFGNIPFLGTLLRNTKQQSQKTELVILLRATIVNAKNTNRQLAETTQRFAGAKRGFHVGGRPDIFGTEGEVPVAFGPAAGNYNPRKSS